MECFQSFCQNLKIKEINKEESSREEGLPNRRRFLYLVFWRLTKRMDRGRIIFSIFTSEVGQHKTYLDIETFRHSKASLELLKIDFFFFLT